jgi:hypothetical protein
MSDWRIVVSGVATDPETAYGFIVQQWPGAGMTNIQNISSDYGLLDGAIFQRQRAEVSALTLTGTINGSSVADLHTKRRSLINAVKPDRSASQEAVVLQYLGSGSTRQASAYFETGLTMNEADVFREKISLRFALFDPFWESPTSSSATLTVQSTLSVNYIAQRAACGVWGNMNSGTNGTVRSIISSSGNDLYIGGSFTTVNNTSTVASRVGQWSDSGQTWGRVGNGMNDNVVGLTQGRDGYLYAAGVFSTASNVAASNVARWSGTAWAAMASGIGGPGGAAANLKALTTDNNGDIVIVGAIGALGGGGGAVTACGIGKWVVSSSSWAAVASGLRERTNTGNATGQDIDIAANGDYWVVGAFDAAGITTNTACSVAVYSQAASAWTTIAGSGTPNGMRTVAFDAGGTAFMGVFGAAASNYLYTSNGVNLTIAASTPTGAGNGILEVQPDTTRNLMYVAGTFTSLGGVSVKNFARFVGGGITPADIFFPGNVGVQDVHSASTGVLTVATDTTGTASAAAVTTITNNGTAATYPILTACAPSSTTAALVQLVNYTTGEAIYFNTVLAPNEIVTLDLRPGAKTLTSNFRGSIINSILPGSNVATWRLLPGANNISFFLTGGSGAAKLSWVERFWSAD